MKKNIFFVCLLAISFAGFSQTALTHDKNIPLSGDISTYKGFDYLDPGDAGKSITWNFSGIQLNGDNNPVFLPMQPQQQLNGKPAYNLLMGDKGYEYYLQSSPDMLLEVACVKEKMSMVYTDPLIRMKFPFSYGDQFTDLFSGKAVFTSSQEYLISGSSTVAADGYGDLRLPSGILHNVLRVKQVKDALELRPCSSCQSRVVSYKWYAPGYRYPVLSMNTVTYQINNNSPVTTQSAYLNLDQGSASPLANSPAGNLNPGDEEFQGYDVTVYPNPFTEKLRYVYFLGEETNVIIQISDVYGNEGRRLLETKGQAEGMHAGELDLSTHTLAPGVYFIRFIFGEKIITRKVVKM